MVNRLSNLVAFLRDDSLPAWLREEIEIKRDAIAGALDRGEEYVISGPHGEEIKITPQPVTVQ